MWWNIPLIPALGRLEASGSLESFESSLVYIRVPGQPELHRGPCLKRPKKQQEKLTRDFAQLHTGGQEGTVQSVMHTRETMKGQREATASKTTGHSPPRQTH